MTPNHNMKNRCFTKHPLRNGCLGCQECVFSIQKMCWPAYTLFGDCHHNANVLMMTTKHLPALNKSNQLPKEGWTTATIVSWFEFQDMGESSKISPTHALKTILYYLFLSDISMYSKFPPSFKLFLTPKKQSHVVTPCKTNMTMEKTSIFKMYLPWNIGWFSG